LGVASSEAQFRPGTLIEQSNKWRTLLLLSLAELLGMASRFAGSVWFSASAVVPALTTSWFLLRNSGQFIAPFQLEICGGDIPA
jgi:hypothetical protein